MKLITKLIIISSFFFNTCKSFKNDSVLFEENFTHTLSNWQIEQMKDGTVTIIDGTLDISQSNGAVVWFKHKLKVPFTITYNVEIIDKGGKNDRVADMNCFWMANDPKNPNNFFKDSKKRAGIFKAYFPYSLYYVGQGGHDNTKTRFRKYYGNGERPLKPEHDLTESKYLITPNKKNNIKIVATATSTQYYCNNILIYNIEENNMYTSGYFGLRSYKNHQQIDDFRVTKP